MPRLRPAVCAAVACVCVPLVSSCATSVDGTGYPRGGAPVHGATAGFPTTPGALAHFLGHGLDSLTSAHLELRSTVSGATLSGHGDETLDHGKTGDYRIDMRAPGLGDLKLIYVGGQTYVHLPPTLRTSTKPWSRLSATTTDPTLRSMYLALTKVRQAESLHSTTLLARAADRLSYHGTQLLDGTTVGHYSLVVDVDKLPDSFPDKAALEQAGLHSLPVQLWVDTEGRTRRLTEHLSVAGQRAVTKVTLSDFDLPVHISPPPASEVDDH